jgi:hypothetical protein
MLLCGSANISHKHPGVAWVDCRLVAQSDTYQGAKECRLLGEERKPSLIAEHPACVFDSHLGDAGPRQPHKLGKGSVWPA